jgi:hypothetical protein
VAAKSVTIQINGDPSGLQDGLDEAGGAMDDFAGGGVSKWGAALAAGFAAAAALAGAAFVKAFADAVENEKTMDRLFVQLGLEDGSAEAAKYGKIASDVYTSAWGETLGDVNNTIWALEATLGDALGGDARAIQDATVAASAIADAYGVMAEDVVGTVSVLFATGMIADPTEGFDSLTVAIGKVGPALKDDLMEAIKEYAPFAEMLGLSTDEFLGLLAESGKMGPIYLDKAGDALKEFTIRGTDMSKKSSDAFASIGLDAHQMANDLLAGGDRADAAFDKTMQGLLGIKDPATQANTAIALFGTQFEDLSVDQIPEFLKALSSGEGALGETAGAAEKAAADLSENASSSIEGLKRTVSKGLADIVETTIIPGVKDALNFVGPIVTGIADGFRTDGIDGVMASLREVFESPEMGETLKGAAGGLWNLFVEGWKLQIQAVPAIWTGVLNALSEILPKVGDWFIAEGWPYIKANWQGWVDAFLGWFGPLNIQLGEALWSFLTTLGGWFISTGAPFIVEEGSKMFIGLIQWLAIDMPPLLIEGFGYAMGALVEWIETDGVAWVISGASNLWVGIVNGFVEAINTIIMLWNDLSFSTPDIPGTDFGGQDVTTANIGLLSGIAGASPAPSTKGTSSSGVKRFAEGGVVFGPTLGMIGEDPSTTPEIVTPEALMRKVVREEAGGGMGGPVYLVLKDGRILAEVVTEATRGRELALR